VKPVTDYLRRKLDAFALEQVSSRSLGVVRIMTSLDIIYEFASPFATHRMDQHPEILVLVWVMFIANWFVLFGYKTRWSTAILAISFGILHLYFGRWLMVVPKLQQPVQVFQVIAVLAIAPSGRSLSIDRALAVRRALREGREPPPERIPFWVLDILAVEVAAIYLWAGLDKTDAAWLHGERMEHYYMYWFGSSDSLVYTPWVHGICVFLAWATTIVELALAVGLLFRRTRVYVVWLGFMLHIGILFVFAVTYFSMMMMTVLFACLPPQRVHEMISLMFREPSEPSSPEPAG
jgi:hypothetical protein